MTWLYILHYDHNLSHAQHYAGITDKPLERFARHADGHGSSFTEEMHRLGILFRVGMLAQCSVAKSRQYERQLKNAKNATRYCEICSQQPLQLAGTIRHPPPENELILARKQRPLVAQIRPGTMADLAEIDQLQNKNSNALGFMPAEALEGYTLQHQTIVAVDDCTTIGYLTYSTSADYLRTKIIQTAVEDSHRGIGFGRALVDYCRISYPRATIECAVRADLPANMFWEAIGFDLLRRRKHATSKKTLNHYQQAPYFFRGAK